MHEDIGADGRHGLLEIQIIVADSVGLLGQAGQILADSGAVTVWGYQLSKALGHPKDPCLAVRLHVGSGAVVR